MSFELQIDRLLINVTNAAGHEHRVRGITSRAISLLAEGWETRLRAEPGSRAVRSIAPKQVDLTLGRMGDEEAARLLADAMLETLALELGV